MPSARCVARYWRRPRSSGVPGSCPLLCNTVAFSFVGYEPSGSARRTAEALALSRCGHRPGRGLEQPAQRNATQAPTGSRERGHGGTRERDAAQPYAEPAPDRLARGVFEEREVSWPIAQAAFAAHTRLALPAETPQVVRLGIDEIRRGKARFRLVPGEAGDERWDVVADKWHVGMVDLGGGAGLLGQVEGRTAAAVSAWIEAQSPAWQATVQVVAIDMCTVFKSAIRTSLPHATLVVDRFHVAQLANAALTEVRRRVTVQQRGRRGRKGNREWELRNRLTRAGARMHAKHLDPMTDDLRALPAKIGAPILKAWNVKEDLMDLLALHGTHPDRTQISALLIRFYENAAACGLPEMQRLAGMVSTWWPQILARHHPPCPRTPHNPHQRTPRPAQTPPRDRKARSSSMSRYMS